MSSFVSQRRGTQILQRMRGRRLAVVGDWMLDRYVWGNANRISPEAAVPVVDFVKQSETLGGAGNVAANLAALGARVAAFGVAGRDEAGAALRRCLREMHLPEKGIVDARDRPTTLKTRIIARQQQVVRVDREVRTHLPEQVEAQLVKSILASLKSLDALVISDYDKGVVSDSLAERILDSCERRQIPSFVKPKWSRLPAYRGASVVICNRKEAEFSGDAPARHPGIRRRSWPRPARSFWLFSGRNYARTRRPHSVRARCPRKRSARFSRSCAQSGNADRLDWPRAQSWREKRPSGIRCDGSG